MDGGHGNTQPATGPELDLPHHPPQSVESSNSSTSTSQTIPVGDLSEESTDFQSSSSFNVTTNSSNESSSSAPPNKPLEFSPSHHPAGNEGIRGNYEELEIIEPTLDSNNDERRMKCLTAYLHKMSFESKCMFACGGCLIFILVFLPIITFMLSSPQPTKGRKSNMKVGMMHTPSTPPSTGLGTKYPQCISTFEYRQSEQFPCSFLESDGYYCVSPFTCNNSIIIDGDGLLDYRGRRSADQHNSVELAYNSKGKCPNEGYVCCKHPHRGNKINNTQGEQQEITIMNKTVEEHFKPKCGNRNTEGVRTDGFQKEEDKGVLRRFRRTRLRKGQSKFGEWPHVCAVLKEEATVMINVYQCVGSLISKEVILTAAGCVTPVKSDERILVRCGEWDVSNENEAYPYQEIYVIDIIIHPYFNKTNLYYDFALLITEEDFKLDKHISPVCLPSPRDEFQPQDCVSVGWGKDAFGNNGNYQTRLKAVPLPLLGDKECERRLGETRLGQFFELHDSFICAGGEIGVDTCKGDGGGPLTCRRGESGPWVQVGIVSWGIGCGDEKPGVYAKVVKAVCWIDSVVSCYLARKEDASAKSVFGFSSEDCPEEYYNKRYSPNTEYEYDDDIFGIDVVKQV